MEKPRRSPKKNVTNKAITNEVKSSKLLSRYFLTDARLKLIAAYELFNVACAASFKDGNEISELFEDSKERLLAIEERLALLTGVRYHFEIEESTLDDQLDELKNLLGGQLR